MTKEEIDKILFLTNHDNRLMLWAYSHIIEPYILQTVVIPIVVLLTNFLIWLNTPTE